MTSARALIPAHPRTRKLTRTDESESNGDSIAHEVLGLKATRSCALSRTAEVRDAYMRSGAAGYLLIDDDAARAVALCTHACGVFPSGRARARFS